MQQILPIYKTQLDVGIIPWDVVTRDLDQLAEWYPDSINGKSTIFNSRRRDLELWAAPYRNLVTTLVKKFMPHVNDAPYDQWAINSWLNRIYPTGHTKWHVHKLSELVVCWYMDKPKDSGNIIILYNDVEHEIEVNTGDVIIFPSDLMHCTKKNNSNKCRYVLTTDISQPQTFFANKERTSETIMNALHKKHQRDLYNVLTSCYETV